ncbi:MAG TPA: hypothetical protein VF614_15625 [Chthoniobacteraceae bacterium]|jgi:hypothetical protein
MKANRQPATEAADPGTLMLQVPLALPSKAEILAEFRAAATAVAERESQWLTARDAARHCGWSLRTFQRQRDELGIPRSEVDGIQRYLRADLDAVMAAHVVYPDGAQVIAFPSVAMKPKTAAPGSPAPIQFPSLQTPGDTTNRQHAG